MVTKIKIHNNVIISSSISTETFHYFLHHLSQSIDSRDQDDYSNTFTLNNNLFPGQSVLVAPKEKVCGTVTNVVNWLRLVEIFILRPHGCYFINQHVGFTESNNSANIPIVVAFSTDNGNLVTKFNIFSQYIDNVMIESSFIPQEMWMSMVNKLTGHNFTTYKHVDNDSGGFILKFYGSSHPEGFIIQYFHKDQLLYHYKPLLDPETFIEPIDVNMTLKRLQYIK